VYHKPAAMAAMTTTPIINFMMCPPQRATLLCPC
jgi:hypothetical protein